MAIEDPSARPFTSAPSRRAVALAARLPNAMMESATEPPSRQVVADLLGLAVDNPRTACSRADFVDAVELAVRTHGVAFKAPGSDQQLVEWDPLPWKVATEFKVDFGISTQPDSLNEIRTRLRDTPPRETISATQWRVPLPIPADGYAVVYVVPTSHFGDGPGAFLIVSNRTDLPPAGTIQNPVGSLVEGQSWQFRATGIHPPDGAVTWQVSQSSDGAVDGTGLYTAPLLPFGTSLVTETVVLLVNGVAVGRVQLRVTIDLQLACTIVNPIDRIGFGETYDFDISHGGAPPITEGWYSRFGAVDQIGRYTAPAVDVRESELLAVYIRDANGLKGQAKLQLTVGEPIALPDASLSEVQVLGVNQYAPNQGGSASLSAIGTFDRVDAEWSVSVPQVSITSETASLCNFAMRAGLGASFDVTARVTAIGTGQTAKAGTQAVATASLRITIVRQPADTAGAIANKISQISEGGTHQYIAVGIRPSGAVVTWTAEVGTITSGGLYTAPPDIGQFLASDRIAMRVNGVEEDSDVVGVTVRSQLNVAITGLPGTMQLGQTVQLGVSHDGTDPVTVQWEATRGTVSAAGRYTAPASLRSGDLINLNPLLSVVVIDSMGQRGGAKAGVRLVNEGGTQVTPPPTGSTLGLSLMITSQSWRATGYFVFYTAIPSGGNPPYTHFGVGGLPKYSSSANNPNGGTLTIAATVRDGAGNQASDSQQVSYPPRP